MNHNNELSLAKTHDICLSKTPRLTVVLIHGIASDSSTYDSALNYLEQQKSLEDVRFITFDLLGSGKSLKDDSLKYDYHDQLTALHNSINRLNLSTPLVLVGHSLGTFIVTRYAATYKNTIKQLILVSPPIYTPADLENPAFELGIKAFTDAVSVKKPNIPQEKSFINSMDKIVLRKDNYKTLSNLKIPTIIIYGKSDQLIAPYNIPQIKKDNPNIKSIATLSRHGITSDKYHKMQEIIEETLNA